MKSDRFIAEKGFGFCGLACCVCSENDTCVGCRSGGCKDKDWCRHYQCCKEKGFKGCWECEKFPCGGMHDKIRVRAFAEFIKQYGEAELMACLERNYKAGVRYHYDGQLVGDYDQLDNVDAVIRKLKGSSK